LTNENEQDSHPEKSRTQDFPGARKNGRVIFPATFKTYVLKFSNPNSRTNISEGNINSRLANCAKANNFAEGEAIIAFGLIEPFL
jgi:hypothetical protein